MKIRSSVMLLLVLPCMLLSCGSPEKEEKALADEARSFFRYDSTQYEPVAIDYHVYGDKDTTLLLIHGWNLNQTYWATQVTSLSNRFKIVTLDLAGHGNSGNERQHWTVEAFAKDVTTLIEKEALGNIILVGHSIGGEIALDVYNQIPDKIIGFIGIDNFKDIDFNITPEFKKSFERYLTGFEKDYLTEASLLAGRNCKSKDAEILARIEDDYKAANPKVSLQILKNMVIKYERERKELRKLKIPLHLIASDITPYNIVVLDRYLKEGYQIEWILGSGHFPMLEKPKPFQRAFEKTLSKILRKTDSKQKPAGSH